MRSFGNQNEIYDKGKNLGKLLDEPLLVEIGKKYGKNSAQTALGMATLLFATSTIECYWHGFIVAWGINNGHSVLPKSKTPSRIQSNLEGDFKLEPEDLEALKGLDKKLRFNDPSASFGWDFYVGEDGKRWRGQTLNSFDN